ncbi:hypothetical protein E4U33_000868, partial [Claviceps sp. LM78 group G4]
MGVRSRHSAFATADTAIAEDENDASYVADGVDHRDASSVSGSASAPPAQKG